MISNNYSLTFRLSILIITLSIVMWIASALSIFWCVQKATNSIFDQSLAETAHSLLSTTLTTLDTKNVNKTALERAGGKHFNQIVFQIWTNNGKLLYRSVGVGTTSFVKKAGFSWLYMNGQLYRSYADWDTSHTLQVQIAQIHNIRQSIMDDIIIYLLIISVPTLLLLGFLIYLAIKYTLTPIRAISKTLESQSVEHLQPINQMVPREIEPLVSSLNLLLTEIVESIEREKRFTSNAAHELRTPLAAIRVHAQVLLNARSASEAKEAALDIITGVDNASRMIAQLLTLARLDPVTPTHEVYFNLAESIESAIKQMNYKLEEAEAHLFLNLSPTYVHGQPDQIEILIRNLLENAILYKSINERPEIRIGCGVSTDSQKIYMSVQDNGIGISKDYLPYIFQRFYRIPGSPSSGSGLGLSIVKQIADRHRATISITSSPRNTVFKIEFPS